MTQGNDGKRQGGLVRKIADVLFGSATLTSEDEREDAEREEREMRQRLRDARTEARSWLRGT